MGSKFASILGFQVPSAYSDMCKIQREAKVTNRISKTIYLKSIFVFLSFARFVN